MRVSPYRSPVDARRHLPWRIAMTEALYGESGFYVQRDAPARHFRTSAHASPQWADAVRALATTVDDAMGQPSGFTLVDVGAGGGELLALLCDLVPHRWSLMGIDVAPRPPRLPDRVVWAATAPEMVSGLVLANEMLDVVPVDVVELTDLGPRLVEVTVTGDEQLDGPPDDEDAEWLRRWWQLESVGDRAEIGRSRDDVWRDVTAHLTRGVAVAIDYAAQPRRDVAGTLTGYCDGRQVVPVPDGTSDLTAHVLFESLVVAGDVLTNQREALHWLGLDATRPSYDDDPTSYLAALTATGEVAELTDPVGLGGHTWLVHPVGVVLPDIG
jgi:SAM-dependent MidA family methyltransferase